MRECLGLSVGATNLVAIADHTPLVRRAVLAVSGHRGPVVGVPSSPDGGLVFTDFVGRVGDPVPLVAADGSTHRADQLLAGAVEALTREVSPAHRPDTTVLAVPAHWSSAAFDSVRAALPGVRVAPDSVAALTAIQSYPGLPARGVVALCDFGGTGTSLTLADAAAGFATIGRTIRYDEFSGDLIDQELLRGVLNNLDAEPAGTAAVTALTRLRDQCRTAKEQLSDQSATSLTGVGSAIRLTRAELDAVMDQPLGGVIEAMLDLLRRNGIHPAQLAALVTVGGGARIPLVTQRLSSAFRLPVTTVPQAQVIAAVGAGLLARRGVDETATQVACASPVSASASASAFASATGTVAASALAWSAEDSVAEVAEFIPESVADDSARPEFVFSEPPLPPAPARVAWYRRGGVVAYAAVFLAVVGTVGMVLSARADRLDAAVTGSMAPQTVPAESPLAQAAPAPPTRTVVVRDPSWPGPAASAGSAPRPAAAPWLVQSRQSAPLAPAPQRVAPAPQAPLPQPAAPAPLPPPPAAIPPIPVPPLAFPPVPIPQLPIPQLPIPTFKPPVPSPSPSPSPTPSPTPEPTVEPSPTPKPTATPTPEPTVTPQPTHTAEPTPEPTRAPEPTQAPTPTSAAPSP
ncbi:Hsp70 family protein [Mycobacterium sp. NPDC050441]|uniref:Hsp70 family protein n=1 Tax=Mycobacterium sp. NPDC050441 TaxID=3155403 RepID=UPI0034090EF7